MSKLRVRLYAYLVCEGLKTIEEIPKEYQDAVKKRIEEIEKGGF